MHEKIQRFSLRKLSVGLASVLVGACIFSVNGKTVKADVTSDQTNQTNNVQTATTQPQSNDVQNEKQQTSSAQNPVTDQPQKNLLDDLGKQKTSTQSGDQAEAQENRLVDQINYKLTNNTNTDNKEDLGQNKVAPDETKQASTTKSDAEKSIVGSSSAQKINNQSNDHADDNSQTQLDFTKSSKPLDQKALATNLTETQQNNDWADPAKQGYTKTTAGWTKHAKDYNAVAKNFEIRITNGTDEYQKQFSTDIRNVLYRGVSIKTTISKDDLKNGANILIGSIAVLSNDNKRRIVQWNEPGVDPDRNIINDSATGEKLGYISMNLDNDLDNNDNGKNEEIDFFFHVTSNEAYAKDLTINCNITDAFRNGDPNYSFLTGTSVSNPLKQCFITPQNTTYEIDYTATPMPDRPENWNNFPTQTNYGTHINIGSQYDLVEEIGNYYSKDDTSDHVYNRVVKISTDNPKNPVYGAAGLLSKNQIGFYLINDKGQYTSFIPYQVYAISEKQLPDNLSSQEIYNQTPKGSVTFSNQKDGSVLICYNVRDSDFKMDPNQMEQRIKQGYWWNIDNPSNKEDILKSTLAFYKNRNYTQTAMDFLCPYSIPNKDNSFVRIASDVTPTSAPKSPSVTAGYSSGGTTVDTSVIRVYSVQYKDTVTGKIINNDTITTQTGSDANYSINIPKGFSLVPNQAITIDGNAITLTKDNKFKFTVPKNESAIPTPIVINLTHKHSTVTDPSQLQTTGKRTITITLPHQDKPMIIVQTVGYKRTGDLDEATNTPTYTDWVFDADTSNVTVNGQVSTQYQAYVLKDGVVNYAPIKLPHINGYKVKLIQDKANPAMFMVSFVALPQQNNQSNNVQSSQKNTQAEQNQPEPIQNTPAPVESDKEVAQILNHIAFELMHNSSSNADSFEPAQNDSDQLENASDSTQKDDAAKPQKVNAAKHKKHIVKKRVVKRHKKHAKKYHLKRRSRKHTKRAKKRIIKHRRTSKKFKKYSLKKHIKRV